MQQSHATEPKHVLNKNNVLKIQIKKWKVTMNLNESINNILTKILDYTKIMSRRNSPLLEVYYKVIKGEEKVDHHNQVDSVSSSLQENLAKELNNKRYELKQGEKGIITVLEDVIRSNPKLQQDIDQFIENNKNRGQVAAAKVRDSKKDVNKQYRILDSMARMLTGKNTCTAVMIYNDRLVVANNQGEYTNAKEVLQI